MAKKSKKQAQLKMGLKFPGSSIVKAIQDRLSKISTLLDQYMFWRSPALWFIIFINVGASIFYSTWIFSNSDKLPEEIALFYYNFDPAERFMAIDDIPGLIFVNILIQAITIILTSKVSSRFKPLSTFMLTVSSLSSVSFYLALYKAISLVVS